VAKPGSPVLLFFGEKKRKEGGGRGQRRQPAGRQAAASLPGGEKRGGGEGGGNGYGGLGACALDLFFKRKEESRAYGQANSQSFFEKRIKKGKKGGKGRKDKRGGALLFISLHVEKRGEKEKERELQETAH